MIETPRLLIRGFCQPDFADLHEYLSDPRTYLFEPGQPVTLAEARALVLQRSTSADFLAVILRQTGKLIGHLYFKQTMPEARRTWELGYIFNPTYQRQGFASEAAQALVDHAFKHDHAHRIMARCNPDNIASWKLLEKIGFVREGYFKKYGFVHTDDLGQPIWTDAYEYSKLEPAP